MNTDNAVRDKQSIQTKSATTTSANAVISNTQLPNNPTTKVTETKKPEVP
jgi:hypothetical protein